MLARQRPQPKLDVAHGPGRVGQLSKHRPVRRAGAEQELAEHPLHREAAVDAEQHLPVGVDVDDAAVGLTADDHRVRAPTKGLGEELLGGPQGLAGALAIADVDVDAEKPHGPYGFVEEDLAFAHRPAYAAAAVRD